MNATPSARLLRVLALGDGLALALVTLVGFSSHGTLASAGVRLLATFLPLVLAWGLAAWPLELYDLAKTRTMTAQLWRLVWALALAVPLAAVLRGIWLNAPVQWIFVLVMAGVSAPALLVWRLLFSLVAHRRRVTHG